MSQKTNSTPDKKWLAAFLYYAEPWEEFLIQGVKPLIDQVMGEKLADQYFFIRYWEKGPHIRLRFKGNPNVLEKKVKPLIIDHFNKYFKNVPSERQDPDWLKEASEEYKWYPNNSVQFIEYEPETERYGGEHALQVSERQFQASSDATLAIVEDGLEAWDYNRALGAAIQLHLGFAHGVGMDQQEASKFFSDVFQNWLPRAYYFFEKDISKEELAKRKEETLKAFEKNFKGHKESLIPFFETVWEAFEEGQSFDQEWLNNWLVDMKSIKSDLQALQEDKKLIAPQRYLSKRDEEVPAETQELWAIYDSYIHMINNRMGIMNRDEGYLAYLVRESIKALRNSVNNG
ncbi:thiopeptide-type bacteriocin biosynthesis protein [Fulvivirga sp. 29W222]|uniref:Thiopeptide-type bacteriocin biosynthesis protein n=1 Tax=Fulvivirga marina TaxID=2494733 RepID=A0A937G6X6_9BACT|nr:thiopeptide-type bacteriocin biosynthesis protein [Fulvivirga marina]MBL6449546.1 thiopeptide-type bacteriocin biosynthesis protein [Fulvivirga marina]